MGTFETLLPTVNPRRMLSQVTKLHNLMSDDEIKKAVSRPDITLPKSRIQGDPQYVAILTDPQGRPTTEGKLFADFLTDFMRVLLKNAVQRDNPHIVHIKYKPLSTSLPAGRLNPNKHPVIQVGTINVRETVVNWEIYAKIMHGSARGVHLIERIIVVWENIEEKVFEFTINDQNKSKTSAPSVQGAYYNFVISWQELYHMIRQNVPTIPMSQEQLNGAMRTTSKAYSNLTSAVKGLNWGIVVFLREIYMLLGQTFVDEVLSSRFEDDFLSAVVCDIEENPGLGKSSIESLMNRFPILPTIDALIKKT